MGRVEARVLRLGAGPHEACSVPCICRVWNEEEGYGARICMAVIGIRESNISTILDMDG